MISEEIKIPSESGESDGISEIKKVAWLDYLWASFQVGLINTALLYGEGNGTPLQYSCLENPMDRGAW